MNTFWKGFEKQASRNFLFKRPYKSRDINKLDPKDPEEAWTAKIDGAHSVINMKRGELPLAYSHRISKRTGNPIEHTPKLTNIKNKSKVDAILRGEVFAVDKKNRAVTPEFITSLLNSGVDRSLKLQKSKGVRPRIALIDVDKFQNKDVSGESFATKRKILEQIAADNEDFTLPDIAYTEKDKSRLLRDIKSGKHKQTKEGLIVHKLTERLKPFFKAKITEDHDVYVRRVYPEEKTKAGRKPMAGGIGYSWDRTGEVIGRIGAGFKHKEKEDMLKNPEKYIGRVARARALDLSKNKVLMKPSFLGWHVEKNIGNPKIKKQTIIINKKLTKDRGKAKELARKWADRLYTSRETGQSFRFRQIPPSKFVPGTFRTSKPADGVSIVYGEVK